MPQVNSADVVVLHISEDVGQSLAEAVAELPAKSPIIVVLQKGTSADVVSALRAEERVVAVLIDEEVAPEAVARIAGRVTRGSVFGLEGRGADEGGIKEILVNSYEQKTACLDEIKRFAKAKRIRGKYRDPIIQCADEMLMNAL